MITMIACMDRDRLIGRGNDMPWKLPEDMSYFKAQTLGKTILMGRNTFESFGARPLKNRRNVILTRNSGYLPDGAETIASLDEALALEQEGEELMVIGGEQIYSLLLPHADCLLLTEIDHSFGGEMLIFLRLTPVSGVWRSQIPVLVMSDWMFLIASIVMKEFALNLCFCTTVMRQSAKDHTLTPLFRLVKNATIFYNLEVRL